jgi:hypothetical protein
LVTGLDGDFSVDLPAGTYTAVASAEGFQSESLTAIAAVPGTAGRRVEFSMLGLSSVTGRVIDGETKRPLVGAKVQAFSLSYVKGQRQRWAARQPSMAGDEGEFYIDRLPAGEYVIEIEPQQRPDVREDGVTIGYPRLLWPGPLQATSPLVLRPRREHPLGNIAVQRTVLPVVKVRLAGTCVENAKYTISVIETEHVSRITRATLDSTCGEKASVTLSPGQYDIVARRQSVGGMMSGAAEVGAVGVLATSAKHEAQLPMSGPVMVTGSVELSGSVAPRDVAPVIIRLSAIGRRTSGQVAVVPSTVPSPIWKDRRFTTGVYSPPGGLVELQLSGLPKGYFIKEILYNGAPVNAQFPFNVYAASQGLRVTLSDAAGSVQGLVKDRDGGIVVGAAVILTPWPMTLDANYPLDLLETRTDANGLFAFQTVKPGEYRVIGVPAFLRQRYEEPDRLASAFAGESTLTITERQVLASEVIIAQN